MPKAGLGKQSFPAAVAKQELRDEEQEGLRRRRTLAPSTHSASEVPAQLAGKQLSFRFFCFVIFVSSW
jgi:hypothetical protein